MSTFFFLIVNVAVQKTHKIMHDLLKPQSSVSPSINFNEGPVDFALHQSLSEAILVRWNLQSLSNI